MNRKDRLVVALLIFAIVFVFFYSQTDKAITGLVVDYETANVERVIDGDTIVANGKSVRLLGINTPERGEVYYEEAKEFLGNATFGKEVRLYFTKEKKDKYGRTLAYIFLGSENINKELIEEGYANYYFPTGKDKYYDDFKEAWQICLNKELNLCQKSEFSDCIKINYFNNKKGGVIIENICDTDINLDGWTIKSEGRKYFKIKNKNINSNERLQIYHEENIFSEKRDSVFIKEEYNKIVSWLEG